MNTSAARLLVWTRAPNHPELNQIYEGEVPLADQQEWQIDKYVGDGKSEVVVTLDMAEKDYGQGGGVTVSVKLTCNQSDPFVEGAIRVASGIARKHLLEQYGIHKQMLQNYGIIR